MVGRVIDHSEIRLSQITKKTVSRSSVQRAEEIGASRSYTHGLPGERTKARRGTALRLGISPTKQ